MDGWGPERSRYSQRAGRQACRTPLQPQASQQGGRLIQSHPRGEEGGGQGHPQDEGPGFEGQEKDAELTTGTSWWSAAKTLCSQCRDSGLIPGEGNSIPHAATKDSVCSN